jgi:hypothetical protein
MQRRPSDTSLRDFANSMRNLRPSRLVVLAPTMKEHFGRGALTGLGISEQVEGGPKNPSLGG